MDVYARRFDADDNPLDDHDVRVNATTYAEQSASRVAAYEGGYVIAWTGAAPSTGGQQWGYAQAFTWDGATRGAETRLNSSDAQPWSWIVAVGMDEQGNFVTTFNSFGDAYSPANWDMYAQRFNADGNRVGNSFLVHTVTTAQQIGDSLAVLPDGSFIAAWQSDGPDGSGLGAFAQRFAADGTRIDGEIQLNTYTAGNQMAVQVAADAAGNFTGVWGSVYQGGNTIGLYGQQFVRPTAITSGTYVLKSNVNASETLTVTATVKAAGGSYLWEYEVHNNNFLGNDNHPPHVFELDFDTAGVTEVSGGGVVHEGSIIWTGDALATGGTAVYSFRTPPSFSRDDVVSGHEDPEPEVHAFTGLDPTNETADGAVLVPNGIAPMPTFQFWTAAPNGTTTTLKVAKWQNSFQDGGNGKAKVIPNFLDLTKSQGDPDRFYVVVYDPASNRDPNAKDFIDIHVETSSDAGHTFSFEETDVDSNKFWSPWLMLVSNMEDKMDASFPAAYRDQLLKVKLGDQVTASAFDYGDGIYGAATVPVDYTVNVHVTVLQMNWTQGHRPVNVPDGTGLTEDQMVVRAKESAEKNILKANEYYAQMGIQLQPTIDVKREGPDMTLVDMGFRMKIGGEATKDELNLFEGNPAYQTPAVDDIELFYVNRIVDLNNASSIFYGRKYDENNVVISVEGLEKAPSVIAHEIGHILTGAGHYGLPATDINGDPIEETYDEDAGPVLTWVNLMQSGINNLKESPTGPKRQTPHQMSMILGANPPSPTGLLKPTPQA